MASTKPSGNLTGLDEEMANLSSADLQRFILGDTDDTIIQQLDFTGPTDNEYSYVQNLIAHSQPAPQPVQTYNNPGPSRQNRSTTKPGGGKSMPQTTPDGIWTEIMEQPKQRGLRFRYECEGRSAGSIPGESSTNEKKTFPTIKIHNYTGTAVIVVSCVTKDTPYDPHPHNLVGRDCKRGVCTLKVKDTNTITFPHLGIQCAKKKDVTDNLRQRKEINVDPYQSGFKHMNKANNIDLNVVRLCFQVFLPDDQGKITRIVPPVVSHPIHDKKSLNELVICRVDRSSGKAKGGDEVFLLCEKINRDDIGVRFYQENSSGDTIWEDYGEFSVNDIHRQYAIVFKTPPYKDTLISQPVEVRMQLKRQNDAETSEAIPFIYMPEDPDPDRIMEKRKRKADQLKSWGFNLDSSSMSGDDIKQRLKLKATKSRIKAEAHTPDIPLWDNIDNVPGPSQSAVIESSSSSVNVRSSDNTAMGNVTITASENVQRQLALLPEQIQNQILQQLAMQKLRDQARLRQIEDSLSQPPPTSSNFLGDFNSQNSQFTMAQQQTASGGPLIGDVSMQQAAANNQNDISHAVDLNMVQTYLGDQGQNVSFDSFGSLTGNIMNIDCDSNVAANVNISSTDTSQSHQYTMQQNEVDAAIQSLQSQS
uniref:NF-kappa B n=1 Tax=Pinctada fucata TaxID=50426 RepID=A9P668_PINFU|nr:NF-kappa B [Pinctada fucata]